MNLTLLRIWKCDSSEQGFCIHLWRIQTISCMDLMRIIYEVLSIIGERNSIGGNKKKLSIIFHNLLPKLKDLRFRRELIPFYVQKFLNMWMIISGGLCIFISTYWLVLFDVQRGFPISCSYLKNNPRWDIRGFEVEETFEYFTLDNPLIEGFTLTRIVRKNYSASVKDHIRPLFYFIAHLWRFL